MLILKPSENTTKKALEILNSGGIIIYPTETCYGVGVDAMNTEAVSKVLKYKKRPEGKPISIGVADRFMAAEYVEINKEANNLYENFLPGPVTVISKSKAKVDKRLESEKGSIGIRIPSYPAILEIIKEFGKPITTTSANSSGKKTPYTIQDILDNISDKQKNLIELIIDAGELPFNPPSTVVDTTSSELMIYRKGIIDPTSKPNETIELNSTEETIDLGEKLTRKFLDKLEDKPLIFLLNGELGAGKTQFTKGVAKALGITQMIKSPTYSYVAEYKTSLSQVTSPLPKWRKRGVSHRSRLKTRDSKLYHIDAWKIQSKEDLDLLGFDKFFVPGNIIVIEWPSVIENIGSDLLKELDAIYVDLVYKENDKRLARIFYKLT